MGEAKWFVFDDGDRRRIAPSKHWTLRLPFGFRITAGQLTWIWRWSVSYGPTGLVLSTKSMFLSFWRMG